MACSHGGYNQSILFMFIACKLLNIKTPVKNNDVIFPILFSCNSTSYFCIRIYFTLEDYFLTVFCV